MFTVPYPWAGRWGSTHVYCTLPLGGGYVDIFTVPYLEGGGGEGDVTCLVYLTSGRLGAVFGFGRGGGGGGREETGTPLV